VVIKAQIAGDFFSDGISVRLTRDSDGGRRIAVPGEGGYLRWEEFSPEQALTEGPALTIRLPDEAARALLDALLRHYQGASDMHTVRGDLLHERGRVDKLTDAFIRMVDRAGLRLAREPAPG
jgi:hypothetical protein